MTRRVNWPVLAAALLAAAYLASAPLWMEDVRFGYLARWMAFAMVGVGIGLAWGYGGMMTLGQGVFFGLGGYAVAMHFQLASMPEGQAVPEWMMLRNIEELPAVWEPLRSPWFAVGTVLLLPTLVAVLLGLLVFRRRVRGAYFAVLTQALAAAFVILLVGQQRLIGGTNGLTGIQYAFGLNRYDPQVKKVIYFIVLATLGVLFLLGWWLVTSRFGRLLVAVRDGEDRVRFLGYDPAVVKTVAFALSATCAGIGGAMFVLAVGSINPSLMGIVPSIEMLIGVALGGRFVLVGAVAGTLLFHYAKTTLSETWEENWNYFYGGLFIVLMVFAPRGLVGLVGQGWDALGRLVARRRPPAPPGADDPPAPQSEPKPEPTPATVGGAA